MIVDGLMPVLLFLLMTFSSGCVVQEMGSAVRNAIAGKHFLDTEDYSGGIEKFRSAVTENPNSAAANYHYGRFLLANTQYPESLRYLEKAARLDPGDPEYQFWLGVAHGSLGQKSLEKKSYLRALAIDGDHLQSLIYLGHNQLEAKQYSQALESYKRALAIWPESPSALYNRALILTKLDREPEAQQGWREYLSRYPSGAMARQAASHLNNLEDFSFRNHTLGVRTVTIGKISFLPFSARLAKESQPSLRLIGDIYSKMHKGRLQIVVYQQNNADLAKEKALSVKRFLLREYPQIGDKNIGVSWFASPETMNTVSGRKKIKDSVAFFVSV